MNDDFNPRSMDSVLSDILAEIRSLKRDGAVFQEEFRASTFDIKTDVSKLRHRVMSIEQERWVQRGAVAVVTVLVIAGWELILKLFH